jgi:hypothetical protein
MPPPRTVPVELYRATSGFLGAFAGACSEARGFVLYYLAGDSGQVKGETVTVIRSLGARQLADTVRELLERAGKFEHVDAETLEDFCSLIARRNVVVQWLIGSAVQGEPVESSVAAVSSGRTLTGPAWDLLDSDELQQDIRNAEKVRDAFTRLRRHCSPPGAI